MLHPSYKFTKLKASQRNSKQRVMVYNASQSKKGKKNKSGHEGPTKKKAH
jgi:hypothetical protein